jgi:hypothetical protein
VFDLYVTTREEVLKKSEDAARVAATPISQLTWVANGSLRTGRFITIKKKTFEIVRPVGAFGYFVQHTIQHPGAEVNWRYTLTGQGLKQVNRNLYQLQVPYNGVATVTTLVQAPEKRQRPKPGRGKTD